LPNLNLIIELDGGSHFQQVSNWQSHNTTRENDIYKMKCAYDNGFSIIRIQQEFVFKNKLDWKTMLNLYINTYEKPTIIFIGDSRFQQHIIDSNFTNNIITHLF
jgi:very-short-patch-repair endonuclease